MTQSNLLELARQGEPSAIAALMNVALEPKGVTAKVDLEGHCLYVMFESTHSLNPETLVQFTYRGLQELNTGLVKTVKLYEQKIGENTISWKREFTVQSPLPLSLKQPRQQAALAKQTQSTVEKSIDAVVLEGEFVNQVEIEAKASEDSLEVLYSSETLPAVQPFWQKYPLPLLLMVGLAFVSGGVAALISTSQKQAQQTSMQVKQQEAETYLREMNQAQQAFYGEKKRFADSLEELERSANMFSKAYYYTYKFERQGRSQTQITAIPKEKGLKSYIGIALLNVAQVTTAICQTQQPTEMTLALPNLVGGQIQCPEGTTQLP